MEDSIFVPFLRLPSGVYVRKDVIQVVRPVKLDPSGVPYVEVELEQYKAVTLTDTRDMEAIQSWCRECSEALPPAEPKPGPWVAHAQCGTSLPYVIRTAGDMHLQVVGFALDVDAANALADRVARLLNESEVTG